MNTDRFYVVETTDKMSKILMPVLTGVILGAVLIRAHYDFFNPIIDTSLGLTALYCVSYTFYMFFKSMKRSSTEVELLKNYLSVVLTDTKGNKTRTDIGYDNIKSYTISPNWNRNKKDEGEVKKENCLLRPFGYKTTIELKNGEKFVFQDSKSDGVLIYSPAYVYRMIDLKRFKPDFPLEVVNVDSKKDIEGFNAQFSYYRENQKSLKLWKNKRYMKSLWLYTILFGFFAFLIAAAVSYTIWKSVNNESFAIIMLSCTLKTFAAIVIPMWYLAITVNIFGSERNDRARAQIKEIIEG